MAVIDILKFTKSVDNSRKQLIQHCIENGKNIPLNASLETAITANNDIPVDSGEDTVYPVYFIDIDGTIIETKYVKRNEYVTPPAINPNYDSDYLDFENWVSVLGENIFGPILSETYFAPRYKPKNMISLLQLNLDSTDHLTVAVNVVFNVNTTNPAVNVYAPNITNSGGYFPELAGQVTTVPLQMDPDEVAGKTASPQIDWGDGSTTDVVYGTTTYTHTYSNIGVYNIILGPKENSLIPWAGYTYTNGGSNYYYLSFGKNGNTVSWFNSDENYMVQHLVKVYLSGCTGRCRPINSSQYYGNLKALLVYYVTDWYISPGGYRAPLMVVPRKFANSDNGRLEYTIGDGSSDFSRFDYVIIPNNSINSFKLYGQTGHLTNKLLLPRNLSRQVVFFDQLSGSYKSNQPSKIIIYNPRFFNGDNTQKSWQDLQYFDAQQFEFTQEQSASNLCNQAYYGATFLTKFAPNALNTIYDNAFSNSSLQEIYVPTDCYVTNTAFNSAYKLRYLKLYNDFNTSIRLSGTNLSLDCILEICNTIKNNSAGSANTLYFSAVQKNLMSTTFVKKDNLGNYNYCDISDPNKTTLLEAFIEKNWTIS